MLVADTSALVSLAIADSLAPVCEEFEVHTTSTVVEELRETAAYDDPHGRGATQARDRLDATTVHDTEGAFQSARIDAGEASCLALAREREADFLLTDDLRALPELDELTEAQVVLSPIVLRALVKRGALTETEARERFDGLVETRDWLGTPIYRRARRLFE